MFRSIFVSLPIIVFSVFVAASVVFGQTVSPTESSLSPISTVTPTVTRSVTVTPTESIQGAESTLPSGAPNTGRGVN